MTEPSSPARASAFDALTERERQVATSLACGMTNREIAEQLSISIKTVDTHRGHVMQKLKTRNNVELLRFMLRDGRVNL